MHSVLRPIRVQPQLLLIAVLLVCPTGVDAADITLVDRGLHAGVIAMATSEDAPLPEDIDEDSVELEALPAGPYDDTFQASEQSPGAHHSATASGSVNSLADLGATTTFSSSATFQVDTTADPSELGFSWAEANLREYIEFTLTTPMAFQLSFTANPSSEAAAASFQLSGGLLSIDWQRSDVTSGVLEPGSYYLRLEGRALSAGNFESPGSSGPASVSLSYDLQLTPAATFLVQQADGTPAANMTFAVHRLSSPLPDLSEVFLDSVTTDSAGIADAPAALPIGAQFRIGTRVHSEPAVRLTAIRPQRFHVDLDNMEMDASGDVSFAALVGGQNTVVLGHTTVVYDLVVSVEWDAMTDYLADTETGLRKCSNFLYDVYDGQLRLGTVHIYDDAEHWYWADVQVHASNVEWPRAIPNGWESLLPSRNVKLPRAWRGNLDATRNATALDVTDSKDFRTRAHELGHYLIGLYDEYKFTGDTERCSQADNYGYMDHHYLGSDGNPMRSELSSFLPIYVEGLPCQNTLQWATNFETCWSTFQDAVAGEYGSPPLKTPIYRPSQRTPSPTQGYLIGPNQHGLPLSADVGALVRFPVVHTPPGDAGRVLMYARDRFTRAALPAVTVRLLDSSGPRLINQGQTADDGEILVLGAEEGDQVLSWGLVEPGGGGLGKRIFQGSWVSGSVTLGLGPTDSLLVDTVDGSFPLVPRVTLDSSGFVLELDFDAAFSVSPSLDVRTPTTTTNGIPFGQSGSTYSITSALDLEGEGDLMVQAVDAGGAGFFVVQEYEVADFSSEVGQKSVQGPNGQSELDLDTTGLERLLLLETQYPALRDGVDSGQRQVGPLHSLASAPTGSIPVGSSLTLSYPDADLTISEENSLRVHRWVAGSRQWKVVGGMVDAELNLVSANIGAEGPFALFTTPTATGSEPGHDGVPRRSGVLGNAPNPFNPATMITFELRRGGRVRLVIHDARGALVRVLRDWEHASGFHRARWDGSDARGHRVASGVYFVRLEGPDVDAVHKMTLVK